MTHTNGIGNANILNTALDATHRTEPTRNTAANAAAKNVETAKAGSSTNLSSLGHILATGGTDISDVRSDKVAALKAAIDSGSYHVPASAVADKLISGLQR